MNTLISRKYDSLLKNISDSFGITLSNDDEWAMRVIYSAIGHLALAALYDIHDGTEDSDESFHSISVTHFKTRIIELYSAYQDMYSSLHWGDLNIDSLIEDIFQTLLKTGHMYHAAYRLSPVAKHEVVCEKITLMRGQALGIKVFRSGLGAYQRNEHEFETDWMSHLIGMFCLHDQCLSSFWKTLCESVSMSTMDEYERFEFLRLAPPFNRGYWTEHPDNDCVSILRTQHEGQSLYYLYYNTHGQFQAVQIPEWRVANGEYLYLANACLKAKGILPNIEYCKLCGEQLVKIKLGYLLPPPELNLLKLYSWPLAFRGDRFDFNRCMHVDVFKVIKSVFEKNGYSFKENTSL